MHSLWLLAFLGLLVAVEALPRPPAITVDSSANRIDLRTVRRTTRRNQTLSGFRQISHEYDILAVYVVGIGTPEIDFQLSIETGVKESFVFDVEYPSVAVDQQIYDPKKSKTSQLISKTFQSHSATAIAKGRTYRDAFVGSEKPWSQNFGSVLNLTGYGAEGEFPADGVMGWGWDPEAPLKAGPTASAAINTITAHPDVQHLSYTYFTRSNQKYWLTYGEVPDSADYIPIAKKNPFHLPAVKLNGFAVGSYKDKLENYAIFDSGYSVLSLPAAQFSVALKAIKPKYDWEDHVYKIECGDGVPRPPKLMFTFGKETFRVRQLEYLVDFDDDDEKCIVAVEKSSDIYHLGQPFFRTYAITFDIEGAQIGLEKHW